MLDLRAMTCVVGFGMLAAPAWAADGFDVPVRKPGCWEHSVVQGPFGKSPPDGSTYECVDATSEQARLRASQATSSDACSQSLSTDGSAAVAWDTTCTDGRVTAKTHVEAAGDFESAYSMTIVSRRKQPGKPLQISKVVAKARWVSKVCPVGAEPGVWQIFGGTPCAQGSTSN